MDMSTQTAHAVGSAPVIPWWTLGDRIRKARLTADMDQRHFADALGVPAGSLAAWETDRVRPRDVVALAKRIELLTRVPAAWLLGLDDVSRPTPAGGAAWAPWDSNPQPADCTSAQVSDATIIAFPSRPATDIDAAAHHPQAG